MGVKESIMNFKNKKGGIALRNIIFMLLIFSGIIALSSVFVTEIGNSYDNDNMTTSYGERTMGNGNLNSTASKFEEIGREMSSGGIAAFVIGGLEGAGTVLIEVLKAPLTFASMVTSILIDLGVDDGIITIIKLFISGLSLR